jgi:lysine-specific demethylase/histidyl-hydroxylase NO66
MRDDRRLKRVYFLDDIDAFILQLEGKKHWRVYKPLNDDEVLPLKSSGDLDKNVLHGIKPCIDVVLEAGDLLYMPRGYIHQGSTLDDAHSLHLTVSCYQQQTWGDLFKILLPKAVDYGSSSRSFPSSTFILFSFSAMRTNVKFRQGLPLGYLNHFGLIHGTKKLSMKKRAKFHSECHRLLDELLRESVPIQMDNSVDAMAQKFMHDALPPMLTAEEQLTTIHEQGERWDSELNRVSNVVELQPDTRVRLLRRHCLRVVEQDNQEDNDDEEDTIIAYYTTDNARSYHDRPVSTLGVDKETLPALEMLFAIYPEFTSVDSLPLATIEDKITFVSTLYEKGLIRTEYELEHSDGEDEGLDSDDDDDEDGQGRL